jgi:alkylhydroperoxidase family enzyme
MLKRIAHARIHRLERAMDYDMTYVHEIVDAGGYEALAPLAALAKLSAYRRDVPIDVYYGAKITSVMAADCGPCAQLVASMAERDGVSPEVLRALLAYAIVAAQAYPTLKYALGYGKACTKVRVAGTEVAPHALVPA